MTTVSVYDRAMCCATGVCGPEVDPALAQVETIQRELTTRYAVVPMRAEEPMGAAALRALTCAPSVRCAA